MKLADEDITELASFCARRFPGQSEQAQLTAQAQVAYLPDADPVVAWTDILRSAQASGALPELARALARSAPADRNLQDACVFLLSGSPRPRRWGAVAAGTTVLVALGLGVGWWWGGAAAPRVVAAPATPTVAAIAATPAPNAATPAPPDAGAPPGAPPVAVEAPGTAAPVPAPAVVTAAPVPAPAVVTAAPVPAPAVVTAAPAPVATPSAATPCAAMSGPIVGYWYAGARAPGAQGDVITLDRDARVRADYPRAENGHDARAAERCVLSRGMRVRLSHAPIDASTGHYWVPFGPDDRVE